MSKKIKLMTENRNLQRFPKTLSITFKNKTRNRTFRYILVFCVLKIVK